MAINFQNLHLLSSQSELILESFAKKETADMKIQYLELLLMTMLHCLNDMTSF